MSTPKIEAPAIQETAEAVETLNLDAGCLNPPSLEQKRGSVQLSVISDESRRQSLFGDDEAEEEGSSEEGGSEEEGGRKRQDEVFVDKARAAMVLIGTKDIKEALERKKAVEISRRTPEAKVAHILFHQTRFLVQQGRFGEALLFLNRALAVDPENKEWLTERSRCYLCLLQPDVALEQVDHVLKQHPHYFKAVVLKGEILYSLWDLERAMLCFVEGRRMRPDNTECIRGVHKVKMALEEIAAFKVPADERRKKRRRRKRSESAKGRLSSVSPTECLLTGNRDPSALSSGRPSSRLSPLSEASLSPPVSPVESRSSARPTTAFPGRRKFDSRSQKSEVRVERPMSAIGKRIKTASAARRSQSKPRDLEIDDIRRFVRESMSKSSPIRRFSESTQQSARSSFSSSMEDMSRLSEFGKSERTKLQNVKTNEGQLKNKVTPGIKVSLFLSQDKLFLDTLLKDRDLKRSKTAYTKRALKIAREVQSFVSEREKYWKNRENFTRYTMTEEDTLI